MDLLVASKEGNLEEVRRLLTPGVKIDIKDERGWTPLMWAAANGHTDVVRLLLEAGAYVKVKAKNGWTPLMWAAQGRHVEVVRLLLAAGAGERLEALVSRATQDGNIPALGTYLRAGAQISDEEIATLPEQTKALVLAEREAAKKGGKRRRKTRRRLHKKRKTD